MNCTNCGKLQEQGYKSSIGQIMTAKGLCFRCAFWTERIELDQDNPDAVVANGKHYIIGDEHPSYKGARGYGGEHFRIFFQDGRVVDSTNLWMQGEIPESFRPLMPDNARLETLN
jgi:hypothetical protein